MAYQLCHAQWAGLDIIDFGLFSWYVSLAHDARSPVGRSCVSQGIFIRRLAYFENNSTSFWEYADHWFGDSDWELRHTHGEPVNFFDFYSPSRNLSVVVRPPALLPQFLPHSSLC